MNGFERGILSDYDFRKTRTRIVYGLIALLIAVMVASMLYPIAITLFNGLKPNVEVNSFPPTFLPSEWHWGNYEKGWNYIPLPKFLRSTLLIFAGNMAMTVIVLGLASFSLSKMNVPFRKFIYAFFLVTLFIPPTTYIIPNFINLKDLDLLNTYYAFWLPAGANAFYLLLLKSFFDSLNRELFEAGRIDGASELQLFYRIAFPLSIPIFATLAIFVFSTAWNDWFWPSMVMHSDDKYPLAFAIYRYVIEVRRLDTNIKFAILSMVMLPPVIIFLLFQKFIIRGLQLGSVKG